MYVRRDENGNIVEMSSHPNGGTGEYVEGAKLWTDPGIAPSNQDLLSAVLDVIDANKSLTVPQAAGNTISRRKK